MVVPSLARRKPAIPSAEVAALGRAWIVTTVVRVGLGLAMALLLVLAFRDARQLEPRPAGFVPRGSTAIVVIDLSQSVTDPVFRRIELTLQRLGDSGEPVGLIAFSDLPYELLPPGSPPQELLPLIRYFRPLPGFKQSSLGVQYPRNPWNSVFSGGTVISKGLEAAREIIERDNVARPAIVLVSDLATNSGDLAQLTRTLATLLTDRIPLRVVPLLPQPGDRAYFARLVGENNILTPARVEALAKHRTEGRLQGENPNTLAFLAGMILFLLAANEWWCRRLDVPGAPA
ncbi:MAG TPA: VWA domain-containing protein [Gaiellaceae bacterium]|jgi:hypothetical protein|nr:VWA domain-containing protein [Gaiellaceae bacterium]